MRAHPASLEVIEVASVRATVCLCRSCCTSGAEQAACRQCGVVVRAVVLPRANI